MEATIIPASSFPLRFSEVVNIRGDFGPGQKANPKGISYHSALDRVLISITQQDTPYGTRSIILNALQPDGTRERFAPGYLAFRDVEAHLAAVPESGLPVQAGFVPGDVYVNRGRQGEISRLNSAGTILADVWLDLPLDTDSLGLWGGLNFDLVGSLGGQMIAADTKGKIFVINAAAQVTKQFQLPFRLEGIAVAPESFGPLNGQMIVGVEGSDENDLTGGRVYAIDGQTGTQTLLADIGYTAENIAFVPENGGTFYHTQLSFERERDNKVLVASASQFLARAGSLIVTNEMSGDLWEVAWDGTRYTQSWAGRAPGRWTSEGVLVAEKTELEHGVFAVRPPAIPSWTDWAEVPGGRTTDAKLNACADNLNNIQLFARGPTDGRIYMTGLFVGLDAWMKWDEVPPGGLTTPHSLGSALHDASLHLFAVRADGHIMHKRLFAEGGARGAEPWKEVPGGFVTNAAVSAAVATGRLVLCAKGMNDRIYINELACGGRTWGGWTSVPGEGHTDVSPTVVNFQDELYLFIKGLTSNKILTKARSADGLTWSNWAELPGAGQTNDGVAAVSAGEQCYVAIKGLSGHPWINIASNTGSWSGWKELPNPGATDVGLALVATGSQVYLFAKGVADRQIYMRRTK